MPQARQICTSWLTNRAHAVGAASSRPFASLLEEQIGRRFRGLLAGHVGFEARDLLLEQRDALGRVRRPRAASGPGRSHGRSSSSAGRRRRWLAWLASRMLRGNIAARRHGCHTGAGRLRPSRTFRRHRGRRMTAARPHDRDRHPRPRRAGDAGAGGTAGAGARARARSWSRSRPPASTGRTCASARATIRRRKGATDIPGLEIAGEVAALGADVKRWKMGDKVCALVVGGGYAQYCLAHESHALPVPPQLSMIEAAAIPETFFTVLAQHVHARRAARAATGCWCTAAPRASAPPRSCWPRRSAPTSSPPPARRRNARRRRSSAPTSRSNYKTEDFVAATKEATGGAGANVIVDIVGGDYIDRNYDAAADRGHASRRCRSPAARRPTVEFRRLMLKRLHHTGSTLRPRIGRREGRDRARRSRRRSGRWWRPARSGR